MAVLAANGELELAVLTLLYNRSLTVELIAYMPDTFTNL